MSKSAKRLQYSAWLDRNSSWNRLRKREENRRLKEAAYRLIGAKCVGYPRGHCPFGGVTDLRMLQIDHIHGDGGLERHLSTGLYRRVLRMGERAREKYQPLCAWCNILKKVVRREHLTRQQDLSATAPVLPLFAWGDLSDIEMGAPSIADKGLQASPEYDLVVDFDALSKTNLVPSPSVADGIAAFRDMMRFLEFREFLQGVPSGGMDMEPSAPILAGKELTEQPTFWDS